MSNLTLPFGLSVKAAAGILAAVVLVAGGGSVVAFQQLQPSTVSLNLRPAATDVPTDQALTFTFSRDAAPAALQAAIKLSPTASGTAGGSGKRLIWTPSTPLAEGTRYSVSLGGMKDLAGHEVRSPIWTFTTILNPKVVEMDDSTGAAVPAGGIIDAGSTVTVVFNAAMNEPTLALNAGGQALTAQWNSLGTRAAVSLAQIHAGPVTFALASGAHDRLGHPVDPWSLAATLMFRIHVHTTALPFPALIQIPNDDYGARDQSGMQAANMVFEYITEGGIRRTTAIYTQAPDVIGPIRSGRLISFKLVRHYQGMLFLSGLSNGSYAALHANPVPTFFDTQGYFYRDNSRAAPDNLMISGAAVLRAEQNQPGSATPNAWPSTAFSWPAGAGPGTLVSVPEHLSTYAFDPVTGTYIKTEEGAPMNDASLRAPLHIQMLVVLHTTESPTSFSEDGAGAKGTDFDMTSGGAAEFYYGGQMLSGHWNGSQIHGPLTFTTANGQQITLPPGLVWVDAVR